LGLLLLVISFTGAACGDKSPQIESPSPTATPIATLTYENLTVDEAKLLVQEEVDLVVLDVRTKEEYESGHLPDAILIPVSELQDRVAELDKDKKILVYCKTGVRSTEASQILVSHGFSSVCNLVGGIDAWIQADGPVISDGGG
jgi:rhodanese-related sulfurtransferase